MECPSCNADFSIGDLDTDDPRCPECLQRISIAQKPSKRKRPSVDITNSERSTPATKRNGREHFDESDFAEDGTAFRMWLIVGAFGFLFCLGSLAAGIALFVLNQGGGIAANNVQQSKKILPQADAQKLSPAKEEIAKAESLEPNIDQPPKKKRKKKKPKSDSEQKAPEGNFVTVNQSDDLPAKPIQTNLPDPDPKGTFERPVRPTYVPEFNPKPVWNIEVDTPAEPPALLKTDLDLTFSQGPKIQYAIPIMASMNGPFALFGQTKTSDPQVGDRQDARKKPKEKQAQAKPNVPNNFTDEDGVVIPIPRAAKPTEQPQKANLTFIARVIDLRTGKIFGHFPGINRENWTSHCRLSPDGDYLVSVDRPLNSKETTNTGNLSIWRRGKDAPVGTIPMNGNIFWCDFVGKKQFAMLVCGAKRSEREIVVWDIAKKTKSKSIAIEESSNLLPEDSPEQNPALAQIHDLTKLTLVQEHLNKKTTKLNNSEFVFNPTKICGDVSPNGRYVSLGGRNGPILISLAEEKQLGTFPSPLTFTHYKALRFSPDGTELWSLCVARNGNSGGGVTIQTWDFATGLSNYRPQLLHQFFNEGVGEGELLPGPLPRAVVYREGLLNGKIMPDGKSGFNSLLTKLPTGFSIDTTSGATLNEFSFGPVRWVGTDQLLAIVIEESKLALRVVSINGGQLLKSAGELLANSEPRPAAILAEPNPELSIKIDPPQNWSAPPSQECEDPINAPQINLPEIPQAFGGNQAAVARLDWKSAPRKRNEYSWQRVDLTTGKVADEKIRLWPWTSPPDTDINEGNLPYYNSIQRPILRDFKRRSFQPGDVYDQAPWMVRPLAALSFDDNLFAACDPYNRCRADVWDQTGKRIMGLEMPDDQSIDWLGWSHDSKLVTIVSGTLSVWNISTGKQVFSVAGKFNGPVAYAAERRWLALAQADVVDLIDLESGNCIARCNPQKPGGTIEAMALSLDGKALAVARQSKLFQQTDSEYNSYLIDVWNLSNGKSFAVAAGYPYLEFIHWSSLNHLLVVSGPRNRVPHIELIDRLVESKVCIYRPQHAHGYSAHNVLPAEGLPRLAATADGRTWLSLPEVVATNAKRFWRSISFPQLNEPSESPLRDPNRKRIDPSDCLVRVEVDLGDRSRSQRCADSLAKQLREISYRIGPNGLALRISKTISDSNQSMELGSNKVTIPKLDVNWELIDEQGKIIWKSSEYYQFKTTASKYFLKSKNGSDPRLNLGSTVHVELYDFKGIPAQKAIEDELLDDAALAKIPTAFPSRPFLLSNGQFVLLPLESKLLLPTDWAMNNVGK